MSDRKGKLKKLADKSDMRNAKVNPNVDSKANPPKKIEKSRRADGCLPPRISNLGYAFQSKDYYITHSKVEEDVKNLLEYRILEDNCFSLKRSWQIGDLIRKSGNNPSMSGFRARTIYPGLVVGMSNPLISSVKYVEPNDEKANLKSEAKELELRDDSAFKAGFFFDYVTGLPCIPGSSIKGMLRSSILKYREEVMGWLRANSISFADNVGIEDIVNDLFGKSSDDLIAMGNYTDLSLDKRVERDVFFDAVIVCGDKEGKIVKSDYITPHSPNFSNPVPIHILALRPEVTLQFYFLLSSEKIAGMNQELRMELYKCLILDLGIGAKTNTGYGRLREVKGG